MFGQSKHPKRCHEETKKADPKGKSSLRHLADKRPRVTAKQENTLSQTTTRLSLQ